MDVWPNTSMIVYSHQPVQISTVGCLGSVGNCPLFRLGVSGVARNDPETMDSDHENGFPTWLVHVGFLLKRIASRRATGSFLSALTWKCLLNEGMRTE